MNPHVVVELVLVFEILPAQFAPVLADLVVVVVLPFLLARRFDCANELILRDFGHRPDVVLGVLLLDLDDESFRQRWQDDRFGRLRFLFLFAGRRGGAIRCNGSGLRGRFLWGQGLFS